MKERAGWGEGRCEGREDGKGRRRQTAEGASSSSFCSSRAVFRSRDNERRVPCAPLYHLDEIGAWISTRGLSAANRDAFSNCLPNLRAPFLRPSSEAPPMTDSSSSLCSATDVFWRTRFSSFRLQEDHELYLESVLALSLSPPFLRARG